MFHLEQVLPLRFEFLEILSHTLVSSSSMANARNTNFFNMGSQSKPPTLLRDGYPQWKIRMVSFLEGVDASQTEFLHNPPYIPTIVVPRVLATATTTEVPE